MGAQRKGERFGLKGLPNRAITELMSGAVADPFRTYTAVL